MKQSFLFVALLFIGTTLHAGEPSVSSEPSGSSLMFKEHGEMNTQGNAPLHLTGVPQVDFFSMRDMRIPISARDSTPQFTDLTEPPSEKSPWLAGALSLAIPGAGEVYAGNYLKGAIFFGIEVGTWVTALIYDKKGDDQTVLFEAYANEHWNAVRYARWTYDHAEIVNPSVSRDTYDLIYDDYISDVDPDTFAPPFSRLNWEELHRFERDIQLDGGTTGYTHLIPYYGQQQYYELIGKYVQFYGGWDDAVSDKPMDVKPSDFTPAEDSRFRIYSRMRAEANDYYDVASSMVSVAIINHVLSALDAAWTASNFNKALHAQVDVKLQRTPYGIIPIKEAKVSWTF